MASTPERPTPGMLLQQARAENPTATTGSPRYIQLLRENGYPMTPSSTHRHGPPPTPLDEADDAD